MVVTGAVTAPDLDVESVADLGPVEGGHLLPPLGGASQIILTATRSLTRIEGPSPSLAVASAWPLRLPHRGEGGRDVAETHAVVLGVEGEALPRVLVLVRLRVAETVEMLVVGLLLGLSDEEEVVPTLLPTCPNVAAADMLVATPTALLLVSPLVRTVAEA